jgi:hypothetical protein
MNDAFPRFSLCLAVPTDQQQRSTWSAMNRMGITLDLSVSLPGNYLIEKQFCTKTGISSFLEV